jgi:hypothetical protein
VVVEALMLAAGWLRIVGVATRLDSLFDRE